MSDGANMISRERERQLAEEEWSPEHDDGHVKGELALAACCYASPIPLYIKNDKPLAHGMIVFRDPWPWSDYDDARKSGNVPHQPEGQDRVRFLVKAGALIAAEIDRLLREDS